MTMSDIRYGADHKYVTLSDIRYGAEHKCDLV